jgi:ribonuclease HII
MINFLFVKGPMVYSALFCPINEEQKLKTMECADSKQLTEKERDQIFEKINENNKFCGYAVTVLSPHSISTNMLRKYETFIAYKLSTIIFCIYYISQSQVQLERDVTRHGHGLDRQALQRREAQHHTRVFGHSGRPDQVRAEDSETLSQTSHQSVQEG